MLQKQRELIIERWINHATKQKGPFFLKHKKAFWIAQDIILGLNPSNYSRDMAITFIKNMREGSAQHRAIILDAISEKA